MLFKNLWNDIIIADECPQMILKHQYQNSLSNDKLS